MMFCGNERNWNSDSTPDYSKRINFANSFISKNVPEWKEANLIGKPLVCRAGFSIAVD
jgi:hypothetical protein